MTCTPAPLSYNE